MSMTIKVLAVSALLGCVAIGVNQAPPILIGGNVLLAGSKPQPPACKAARDLCVKQVACSDDECRTRAHEDCTFNWCIEPALRQQ